jgi:NDP-sugar pyrophosphorylase family protein
VIKYLKFKEISEVSLQAELDGLSKKIAVFKDPPEISDEAWAKFAANCIVVLMVGGESSRYATVLEGKKVNKNAHELPNGDTMLEMTIRMYRDAGIKKFVACAFHNAHSIEERLGDGSKMGVEIVYSYDPEQQVGRGGAIRNALDNGSIPDDCNLVVVNPADLVFNFPGSFPRYIVSAHLEGEKKGMLATAVMAPGQPYIYTGMMIDNNKVIDTQAFPFIPVPAHAGITLFSHKILPRFRELFSLEEISDFEQVLFPLLAQEEKLWSVGVTKGICLAVKDLKSYKTLLKLLEESKLG